MAPDGDDDGDGGGLPPWAPWVLGAVGVVMAVTIAVLLTLLLTKDDGGEVADDTTTTEEETTTTSSPSTTTSTTEPAPEPTDPPVGPDIPEPGDGTAEGAIATWAIDQDFIYVGDCAAASPSEDVILCSTFWEEGGDSVVYGLGPPASEIAIWVLLAPGPTGGLEVIDSADAFEFPTPPF
ncbi:MAG: hypothetical protein R3A49_06995 [Acidimicrobiia bacterium]